MDFFAAFHALSSFDHEACNRILFERQITLPISRFRDGGYGAWRNYYVAGPFVALFAVYILSLGIRGVMDYSATCTALLHGTS